MNISIQFNKFSHSLINDLFKNVDHLVMSWKDNDTGEKISFKDDRENDFIIIKDENYHTADELKQWLKIFNINYPPFVRWRNQRELQKYF